MAAAIADRTTIAALTKANGAGPVLAEIMVLITRAMEYYSNGRAITPAQCALLAEAMHERYPYETLSDIALFLRRAAIGEFDDGKTFGALDIPLMMRWWRQHMAEKVDTMEVAATHQEGAEAATTGAQILALPGVKDLVERMNAERKAQAEAQSRTSRRDCLQRDLPRMDLDQMREAWGIYTRGEERAMIQSEAARRGFLGEELQAAQVRIDQGAE